jgi:hypothetical protein
MPKLTKEMVDNLIKEAMLNEDPLGPTPVKNITADAEPSDADEILKILRATFGQLLSDDEIESIAKLSESKINERTDSLEVSDLEALFGKSNPDRSDEDLFDKVNQSLIAYINRIKDPAKARQLTKAKKLYDDAIMKIQGLAPSVETDFATVGRTVMPATAGGKDRAPVDPALFQSFEGFFSGVGNDLKSRVKYLSDFSVAVYEAAQDKPQKLNNYQADKIILGGNILSTISRVTRQIDPSAGGIMAEAFLAFIVGGAKVGQAGGAADFVGADGKQYSSKWGATGTQAVNNFTKQGEVVTYISAEKTTESGAKVSDTTSILDLVMYVYDVVTKIPFTPAVEKEKDQIKDGLYAYYSSTTPTLTVGGEDRTSNKTGVIRTGYIRKGNKKIGGTKREKTLEQGDIIKLYKSKASAEAALKASLPPAAGRFDVTKPASIKGAPFKLVTASSEVFDQIFSKAVNNSANDLVKAVAKLYAQTKSIEDNSTSYVASGDFSDAVALADQYADLKDSIKVMITKKSDAATATGLGLAENKQKKFQDLDRMIEELMLEHLQGDTDDNN